MKSTRKIRIAFVHDDFIQFGGAERLILDVIKEFSMDTQYEIKVFSSLISPQWKEIFKEEKILFNESFLGSIPFCYRIHKFFFILNFFYIAFYDFDFSDFNIVISSSTRFGHCILCKPQTYHISYINSPSRGLWEEKRYFFGKKFLYLFIKNFLPKKRIYDLFSQFNSDLIISNSLNIKNKVKKFYRRNSIILYPFYEGENSNLINHKENIYLLVSRLVSWKRIDFVIDTFNLNGEKLIIIGDGPDALNYKKKSNKNIIFLGFISDQEKNEYFKKAKYFIFPQNEDFGITLLEAVNYNCIPIYYKKGGANEILRGIMGIGFENQNVNSLQQAVDKAKKIEFTKLLKEKVLSNFQKESFIGFVKKLIHTKFNY